MTFSFFRVSMKQFLARVLVILTIILLMAVIARIIKWFLGKSNWLKNKIALSWKEKIKSKQIKKELKENKETIINPNAEDTKNDEKFQEIIETAVAEKNEEENIEENKESKNEKKENKSDTIQEDSESSVFDETASLDTPSEKVLDEKEKKMIDRIIIDATTLKNWWKYDEYEKKIIEWLAIDPSNLELTKMLADYYFVIWSYKKALPLLKKITEWTPDDHKSLWQIWEIYFINWDNWTAELLVDKAVNLKPDSPKYNLSLVEIYYNTGRMVEAISCMEKVIKLRPTNTNYLFTLAMLYEEIWDIANAKKNYFTILEFEPSNDKAKKKLRQLTD